MKIQRRRGNGPLAATAAASSGTAQEALGDLSVSSLASAIISYAIEFARVSETYEVNSWMLLLGVLRYEKSTAAKALARLGLTDAYGAWNEVLWALKSVNALERRAFVPEIGFADRAYHVLVGATHFAAWGGRSKVQSEDILMALAAGNVLDGLFPDLKLTFSRVRKAVEKEAGGVYVLPDDPTDASSRAAEEEDNFL